MDYKEKVIALLNSQELSKEQKEKLEEIFPELKESEDERIRKALLDYCKSRAEKYPNDPKYKNISTWIAWLEKQGEQKPTERVEINKSLSDAVITELSKYNGENYWKSPWAIDSTGLQYPLYFANLGATWQKKQKPAWSKEDERMFKNIIALIETLEDYNNAPDMFGDAKFWLKSLRPQNTWKPSEEQMKALNTCIMQGEISYVGQGTELQSLYNDLKKLTE